MHRKREKEMDILCEEISTIKEKLKTKLGEKKELLSRPNSNLSYTNSQSMTGQTVEGRQTNRLRPITVASTNSEQSK